MTASSTPDVIDRLLGTRPGDAIDLLRARRPQAREQAQQSYLALFEPAPPPPGGEGAFSAVERFAVAAFVASLHEQADIAAHYATGLAIAGAPPGLLAAVQAEAVDSRAPGPYGRFPAGVLSRENLPGPFYAPGEAARAVLGPRLAAALAHAHLLVLHPRDAEASALQALLQAGWTTTEIVTLSQLVAFLAFQIRVVTGLRALAALPAAA